MAWPPENRSIRLSHLQLADVETVLESLTVLPKELDPLVLRVNLVPLVVDKVASVDHPEVEVDVDLELLAPGLLGFA